VSQNIAENLEPNCIFKKILTNISRESGYKFDNDYQFLVTVTNFGNAILQLPIILPN